ncbi:hypothetical protein NC651_009581 [Populus alba x Populus x berolinensis]|nr:hypothetical protein NC651_009581 [Populus alba x Populus x berolinensis]
MEEVENELGVVETYNSREGEVREMVEVETCRTMKEGEIFLEVEVKSSGMEVVVKKMVKVETYIHMQEKEISSFVFAW